MSFSDGFGPYFFRRKMEKTRSMREEMDGQVFISRQSQHFSFIDDMIKVLFPIFTLIWRANNCDSRQGKDKKKGKRKYHYFYVIIVAFAIILLL